MSGTALGVLLLEDDPDDAELLRQVLRRDADGEYEITRVEDEAGFRTALGKPWDIVVADYRLPSYSAPAALALLHELGIITPVVVVSGQIGDEAAAELIRLGAVDFLSKDRLAGLPLVLRRCLAETRERQRREVAEHAVAEHAALLDLIDDAIIVCDPDQVVTYWGRGAQRTYGLTPDEAVGRTIHEILRTEFPRPLDEILDLLDVDGTWEGELVQQHQDGDAIVVISRWNPRLDEHGKRNAIIQVDRDITSRKATERELAQRTGELESVNAELARSNTELAQFAYLASHDLAAPLRAISGPLLLLERRYAGRLDADADEFIGFAVDACARMNLLIDGLLALSRVGRPTVQFEPTHCDEVVSRVLTMLGPTIAQTQAQVTVGPLPTLTAQPVELAQVFQNLIANAVKYVPEGTRPEVTITAERAGQPLGSVWQFSVADNGIGIEPRHRDRIFDMFQRLHTDSEYPGTGIGLALVKKIVERHGGHVEVSGAPDGGSTFTFTISATLGRHPAETAP